MNFLDVLNIIGFGIGILGIVLSVYFYIKSIEKKDPVCYYATFRDIEKLSTSYDKKVRVLYDDQEVNRVFTTYLWFWNKGKKPITKQDLRSQENILFTLNDEKYDVQILDYEILKASRDSVNLSLIKESPTTLKMDFDFLDQDDGAVIVIQHTGSGNTVILSNGTILGVPKGIQVSALRKEKPLDREEFLFTRMAYFFPLKFKDKMKMFLVAGTVMSILFLALIFGMDYLEPYMNKFSEYLNNNVIDRHGIWLKLIVVVFSWVMAAIFTFDVQVPYPDSLSVKKAVEIDESDKYDINTA